MTRWAIEHGLPLESDSLLAINRGQVKGLSGARIASILASHGEYRRLASEGGRTSRGSIGNMEAYVAFLNEITLNHEIELRDIEEWWVEQVTAFFDSKPFTMGVPKGRTYEAVLNELFEQVETRQNNSTGTNYLGIVLQHLVGAKLELALGNSAPTLEHHGASVADHSTERAGDFRIDDSVIHVTTMPSVSLFEKCRTNIRSGLFPIIITRFKRTTVAQEMADNEKIRSEVEIVPAEQFLAANLLEWGRFNVKEASMSLKSLISMYNQIVVIAETDLSLRIEFKD